MKSSLPHPFFLCAQCNLYRVIRVKRSQSPLPKLLDQTLEMVPCAWYTGVDISHYLSWKPHIARITGNANKSLDILRRNLKATPTMLQEKAYKVIARPKLEYAAPLWVSHIKNDINTIEMVQRRAARWFFCDSTYSSVYDMLVKLGWRTIEQWRADSRLAFFYKIIYEYEYQHILYHSTG